jgi:phosphoenolpyruvate carboxykinase (ATP)
MDFKTDRFLETVKGIEATARKDGRLIENPSEDSLRALTAISPGVRETCYGSLAFDSEPNSRAAKHCKNNIDDIFGEDEERLLSQMEERLRKEKLVLMDRQIGSVGGAVSRLIVPIEFVKVAYAGGKLFYPAPRINEPDNYIVFFHDDEFENNRIKKLPDKDVTIRLGMFPDGRVVKVIRNSDYLGEYKKGNFAAEEWRAKMRTPGIFLHSGCRTDYLQCSDGEYREISSLLIALSANGKTSTTCRVLARKEKEISWLVQDDGGILMPDGSFKGFEGGGIFVKTEGVSPENQIETYYGLLRKETVMQDVYLDKDGKPDFFDYSKTSNGRAVVRREDFMHASPFIDSPKIDNMILITRGPNIPAISKLTKEQTVALMILGQAMQSSAGDPTQAGKIINEFFYDPFFVGDKTEHAHRLYGILEKNPKMQFYLLNTGHIGEGDKYDKITLNATMSILDSLVRGGLTNWKESPSEFLVPVAVRGLSDHYFHPEKLYGTGGYNERQMSLNEHRRQILEKIDGLEPKIRNVF